MSAWHEEARFDVFGRCDVFEEDGHFLLVEEKAFDYAGNYACAPVSLMEDLSGCTSYVWGDWAGASNDYVSTLTKAPWETARRIVERNLARLEAIERTLDGERGEGSHNAPIIEDARRALMDHSEKDGYFTYC